MFPHFGSWRPWLITPARVRLSVNNGGAFIMLFEYSLSNLPRLGALGCAPKRGKDRLLLKNSSNGAVNAPFSFRLSRTSSKHALRSLPRLPLGYALLSAVFISLVAKSMNMHYAR